MKPLPSIQELREAISYDPITGICSWKERPRQQFKSDWIHKWWNLRFSGKEIKTICGTKKRKHIGTKFNCCSLKIHRAIWAIQTGEWPNHIDHKDGDSLNNKWENLRNGTVSDNMKNKKKYKPRELPTGVYFSSNGKKYWAEIQCNKNRHQLGYFDSLEDAAKARKEAELRLGFSVRHGS